MQLLQTATERVLVRFAGVMTKWNFAGGEEELTRFSHAQRWVTQPAVDVAVWRGFCAFDPIGCFHVGSACSRIWEHKGGGGVHRGLHRHVGVLRPVSCEHCAGFQAFLHGSKVNDLFHRTT